MWQFAIMIKTQITVPDELYEKAKKLAKAKEWSLAEVFRRGLEYVTSVNFAEEDSRDWKFPTVECGDTKFKTASELNSVIQDERESQLLHKANI